MRAQHGLSEGEKGWAGIGVSSYGCRLRVNFHCWVSDGLHTSTVRPPFRALRLSRHRLLPTCRSLELLSICSHFCNGNIMVKIGAAPLPPNPCFEHSMLTCLLSFSLQPCSLICEPAVRSTTVRQRSMCLTDLSLVRAHSCS